MDKEWIKRKSRCGGSDGRLSLLEKDKRNIKDVSGRLSQKKSEK